jgi:hypothetical protein
MCFNKMSSHLHHIGPKLSCLLCPRTFLFRQVSVPDFVISQVVPKENLAVDPMHRVFYGIDN